MTRQRIARVAVLALTTAVLVQPARAAPDEALLGRDLGYPVASTLRDAYRTRFLVGSFSGMDRIEPTCRLPPAPIPRPLQTARPEAVQHYRFQGRDLTLDDYMQRQRATAVLVLKDDTILAERYNYRRTPAMRMLSNSMAKTIVSLAIGKALEAGSIRSLDDTVDTYVPALQGTLYGGTRLVSMLRMASGARFVEAYTRDDDRARFTAAYRRDGTLAAARSVTDRADPEGTRFNYAGAQTQVLGLVLRAATGESLCDYVDRVLWQPIGAEAMASWVVNPVDQVEIASGAFSATVRDYARLGAMLAQDGRVAGTTVMPPGYLRAMTDPVLQPDAFRPGQMDYHGQHYYGYGYQIWLLPGPHRQFALLGIYGQAIYVDPVLHLVMVHTAVGADVSGDASGNHLGPEREALWRGVVAGAGEP